MNILDQDFNTLTVLDKDNKILIRNVNEYNILKYKEFDGKQIEYKKDGLVLLETFNDGIFNLEIANSKHQSSNKNEVAKRIFMCRQIDSNQPLLDLFKDEIQEELNEEFFKVSLAPFENRIKINDKKIIIDDIFMIDENGQAHFKNINGQWKFLCIVAGNPKFKHFIQSAIGRFEVDYKTIEIYYKVLFLLYPDKTDSVFYNQLPKHIKEKI